MLRTVAIFLCLWASVFFSAISHGEESSNSRRGVTVEPREVERPEEGLKKATLTPPSQRARTQLPAAPPPPPLRATLLMLIDSLKAERLIPAGERYAVCFDFGTRSLRDTLLPDPLTPLAREAVREAPDWLKPDLADNLRRMDSSHQDIYADLILYCPDKRYYDEVCFQIAHLSPQTLTYHEFNPDLLVENVQLAYELDRELQYVDIVDYGDPIQGGDYYSTTKYWTVEAGDTVEVEIPREIYYWWVISPKLSDELPRMDGSVYNYFWREYLYYFCDATYPLLREHLSQIGILWDGNLHTLPAGRPFTDTTFALDVIANWATYTVPDAASGNRPIQPNQIAHEHNGNCGELQDLLSAAARTGLIPAMCTCDINEDHVWVEFWWRGELHPYQVDLGFGSTHIDDPRVAYDHEYGGGKEVSAIWDWRGDGYQFSNVGRYSDCCTLTVTIGDVDGDPIDGAIVKLASEFWYGGIYDCFYGVTDRLGKFTTTLGDSQNYYLSIESDLGNYSAGRIIDSLGSSPGAHFYFDHNLPGQMYELPFLPDTFPPNPEDWYKVELRFNLPHEAVYGYDCYNRYFDNWYTRKQYPGRVDFFIADAGNLTDYLSGNPFYAYEIREDTEGDSVGFVFPSNESYYMVFSDEEQLSLTELTDLKVYLYENQFYTGVARSGAQELRTPTALHAAPNPFSHTTTIRFSVQRSGALNHMVQGRGAEEQGRSLSPYERINLSIYDIGGRLVRTLLENH